MFMSAMQNSYGPIMKERRQISVEEADDSQANILALFYSLHFSYNITTSQRYCKLEREAQNWQELAPLRDDSQSGTFGVQPGRVAQPQVSGMDPAKNS